METQTLTYKGREYPVRMVKDSEENELLVSTLDLLDALHPFEYGSDDLDGYDSLEAMELDDQIFFYVDGDEISLPEDKLIEALTESNPEIFI